MDKQTTHVPGAFKRPNKPHKGHKNSARSLKRGGKEGAKVHTGKKQKQHVAKEQRKSQLAIQRKAKREEVLEQKRHRGHDGVPPFLVAIIPLCESVDAKNILKALETCPDATISQTDRVCHINSSRLKQRFAFIMPAYGDLYAIMDAAKVADCLLFGLSLEEDLGDYSDHILSCLFAHGLPASIFCVQGLKSLPVKKQSDARRIVAKQIEKRFPEAKIHSLDGEQDAMLLLRSVGGQKLVKIPLRENRPYMLANEVTFVPKCDDKTTGILKVTGYLRGQNLDIQDAVHIPGWGDFQINQIDALNDPHRLALKSKKESDDVRVLSVADLNTRVPLEPLASNDEIMKDQTWPTEEELNDAEEEQAQQRQMRILRKMKAPKEVSEYQAAWYEDNEDEPAGDDLEEEEDDDCNMEDNDDCDDESESDEDDAASYVSNDGSMVVEEADKEQERHGSEMDDMSEVTADYDKRVHFADDVEDLKRFKEARLDQKYPDEVDTPHDNEARKCFENYRGLASFRTSPWENRDDDLPAEYERILHFTNFRRACKVVMSSITENNESKQCQLGDYLTLHIDNIPAGVMNDYEHGKPLAIFGLVKSEHCISVVNLVINYHPECDEVVKSEEPMIFHVGYRRFHASPIYSQHTNGDKHKMERFLRSDGAVVASVYAPVMFPPASVLMFKQLYNGEQKLVATGRVLSADPNRLMIERIILRGHPFKINKKTVVARYMFFNRDDILWFRPVELKTKSGKRGSILEPLGTHGHMRCSFNGQLKSHDVIIMNLYKRVFPKMTYDPYVPNPFSSSALSEDENNHDSMDIFD